MFLFEKDEDDDDERQKHLSCSQFVYDPTQQRTQNSMEKNHFYPISLFKSM